jgi:hypothetical protein
VPFAVVHHGGMKKYCTTVGECAAIVRSYQNYHIDCNGWNDIGYNFLIGEDGNVYEGRGWEAVGAHAPTYNTRSIGICIIGDFTGTRNSSSFSLPVLHTGSRPDFILPTATLYLSVHAYHFVFTGLRLSSFALSHCPSAFCLHFPRPFPHHLYLFLY